MMDMRYYLVHDSRVFNDPQYGTFSYMGEAALFDGNVYVGCYDVVYFTGIHKGKAFINKSISDGLHHCIYSISLALVNGYYYGIPGDYGFDADNFYHRLIENAWFDMILDDSRTVDTPWDNFQNFFTEINNLIIPIDPTDCYIPYLYISKPKNGLPYSPSNCRYGYKFNYDD